MPPASRNIYRHAPFGSLRHAARATTSPELAAIEAAVRGVTIEPPLASRDIPVRHGDAITVGSGETAPAGRVGLTEQMGLDRLALDGGAAQRAAGELAASLRADPEKHAIGLGPGAMHTKRVAAAATRSYSYPSPS